MPDTPFDRDQPGPDELDELRALAARTGVSADDPVPSLLEPPDDLWPRIAADAGVDDPAGDGGEQGTAPTVLEAGPRRRRWLSRWLLRPLQSS